MTQAPRGDSRSINRCTTACFFAAVASTMAAEEANSIAACINSIEPSKGYADVPSEHRERIRSDGEQEARRRRHRTARLERHRRVRCPIPADPLMPPRPYQPRRKRRAVIRPAAKVILAIYAVIAAACGRFGNNRAARCFDIHRHEARFNSTVFMPFEPAQYGVDRFRMKRRQPILRIRLETEQLLAPLHPSRARRIILARAERARHDAAVAEAVKNGPAAIEFHAADQMRVMTDHDMRARIDRRLRHRPFVGCQARRRMHQSLVQSDDDEIVVAAGRSDVGLHLRQGLRVRRLQGSRR